MISLLASVAAASLFGAASAAGQVICLPNRKQDPFYYHLELDDRKRTASITQMITGMPEEDNPLKVTVVKMTPKVVHFQMGRRKTFDPDRGLILGLSNLRDFVVDRMNGTLTTRNTVIDSNGKIYSNSEILALVQKDLESFGSSFAQRADNTAITWKMNALYLSGVSKAEPELYSCAKSKGKF